MGYSKKSVHSEEPALITGKEFAAALRVNEATVVRWYHAGIIEGFALGGGKKKRGIIRYPRAEITRLLRESSNKCV